MQNRIMGLAVVGLFAVAGIVALRAQEPKPIPTSDGRVPAGEYVEIDLEGQANRNLLLLVQEVSPNIIHLRGKYGWVAFVSFDAEKKEYRGFFEWPDIPGHGRPGGKWADLYQIRVTVQDGVLRIEGKSAKNEMLIRAKPSGGGPAQKPSQSTQSPEAKR